MKSLKGSNAAIAFIFAIIGLLNLAGPSIAQNTPFILRGDAALTGFSGTMAPTGPLLPGTRLTDETFIDLQGKVMRLFNLSNLGGPAAAQLVNVGPTAEISAGEIGQVFGTAFDDGIRDGRRDRVPNLYLTATSMFGLQIVIPDRDGDGRPERVRTGRPAARWMAGQFGERAGGGPGAIWKLDGLTGQISLFANLATQGFANQGAGLGNIAFDPRSRQLFVSDLETGLITAFDLQGNALFEFDHGINGRPNKGLDPVADDPARRLDITNADFDSEDIDSWGYAVPQRRVFGLGVRGGRLYYALKEPLSIWSVAINDDGSFSGSGRWEFDVLSPPRPSDITDITFDDQGRLYIAQRGKPAPRYDYSSFAKPRRALVRIYRRESPDNPDTPSRWIEEDPREAAIGFPIDYRNTTGGIALGYGYDKRGRINYSSCRKILWTTGEHLRQSTEHAAALSATGPLAINGLQGNDKDLVRPDNAPPWQSWFIDFDNRFDDAEATGQIGDIEIFTYCPPRRSAIPQPRPDLKITKKATSRRCFAGRNCKFDIYVENVSRVPYRGPIIIQDDALAGAPVVDYRPKDPIWNCEATGWGSTQCARAPLTLLPGKRVKLSITTLLPNNWRGKVFRNCAQIRWQGQRPDAKRRNDKDCAYVPTCARGDRQCKPDIRIEKYADSYLCDAAGRCNFWIEAVNVGGATYTGQPRIDDQFAVPGATLTNYAPAADWFCAGGSPISCTHKPVTLAPGEGVWLNVEFQLPPPALAVPGVYENCSITRRPVPGGNNNTSPLNDYSCTRIAYCPPGAPAGTCPPDLEIEKFALSAVCLPGSTCRFGVEVRNVGTSNYTGPIVINDPVAATGMTFVGNSAGWTCDDIGGTRQCRVDAGPAAVLAPGESTWLELTFALPAGFANPVVQNCASIAWPGPTDANNSNDGPSCVTVPTNVPSDIGEPQTDWSIVKTAVQPTCNQFKPCYFNIQVTNNGPGEFLGVPGFQDPIPPGLIYVGTDPLSPWQCVADVAASHLSCSLPTGGVSVPPGEMPPLQLEYRVDPAFPGGLITNTATVNADAETDPNFGNNSSSASVIVPVVAPASADGPQKITPIRPPPPAIIPTPRCGRNQIRTGSGRCVCKSGYRRLLSNACVKVRPPQLVCKSGWTKFRRGSDFPSGWLRSVIRRGGNRILCGRPPPGGTIGPGAGTKIACSGGKVRRGRCNCAKGYLRARVGKNAWRCIKRSAIITTPRPKCVNGTLQRRGNNWSCKCAAGSTLRNGVCSKPRPRVRCDNGFVRGGQCRCSKNRTRQSIGLNAWRCVQRAQITQPTRVTQPTRIKCSGGVVRKGQCYCAKGKRRVRTGNKSYVCRNNVINIRPQIKIKPKFNGNKIFTPKTLKLKRF